MADSARLRTVNDASPTVIVSRRAKVGLERQFEEWNDQIRAAAARFEGYLGSEAQPPDTAHPDEWVIVYQFHTQANLDRWLDSAERASLMAAGQHLLAGPVREQRLARPSSDGQVVTAIMSQHIRPEDIEAFRKAEGLIALTMSAFAGFISLEHSEPVPGVQDDYIVAFTFASRADLDRWLQSDARRDVLQLVEPFIEGERTLNVVRGFGGWFVAKDEQGPPRWKQAVTVLIALYPTTLTLGYLQNVVAPDVPWVPALFVSNVLGIAILTWLLMPVVTRLLRDWLRS